MCERSHDYIQSFGWRGALVKSREALRYMEIDSVTEKWPREKNTLRKW